MIREKKTKAGDLLNIDYYPVSESGRRLLTRAKKENPSTAKQANYNQKQATRKMIELVNTNFKNGKDYFAHITYQENKAPESIEQARKDINNYLRRVSYHRDKKLKECNKDIKALKDELAIFENEFLSKKLKELKAQRRALKRPFKYIYVIEQKNSKAKYHFHLFISGGLDSKEIESLWNKGVRVKISTYKPDVFGLESAAAYMVKDPKGSKRFVTSRNLSKPIKKTKDGVTTRSGLARMAQMRCDDVKYWEQKYKGYRFIRSYPRFNPYNNHWYLTVVMYKSHNIMPSLGLSASEWLPDEEPQDFKYIENITSNPYKTA